MVQGLRQRMGSGRFRKVGLAVIAFAFLAAGFVAAPGLYRAHASKAAGPEQGTHLVAPPPAIPSSFSGLAQKLSPTVVNIKVTKIAKVSGFQWPQNPEGPFGDIFKHFLREMPQPPENFQMEGAGSGVIISADGYIVTNNHVVEGAKEVTVTLADKDEYKAKVVGRDPKTDLAVLKIETKEPLSVAQMGDSDKLKVGDWVLAIGNPFGLNQTVTSGIVSAKGRVIGAGPYDDFIQTDASINPGNSGGPLFNMEGKVVGINTAIIPYGQGIGFAIPINVARPLIPQLETKGEVTRGYLGVMIQSVTPELAKAMKLENEKGALVSDVMPGTPADKGGIHQGDLIVKYNGEPVQGSQDLPAMVARTPVGEEATVTVLRDGVEHQLAIKVAKLPGEGTQLASSEHAPKGKWGLMIQELSPQMAEKLGLKADKGVAVVGVEPGSPAQKAGIREGDIILQVNRHDVKSVEEVQKAIAKNADHDSLLLLVKRDQGNFFVALEG